MVKKAPIVDNKIEKIATIININVKTTNRNTFLNFQKFGIHIVVLNTKGFTMNYHITKIIFIK